MKNPFAKPALPPEQKKSAARAVVSFVGAGQPVWSPRDYASLARHGYERNVVGYRCIRFIAEAVASAPLVVKDAGAVAVDHPLAALLKRPNPEQSGPEFIETLIGFLQTAGNVFIEAVRLDGSVRELYALRPDRIHIIVGSDGWPVAYEYKVETRKTVFRVDQGGLPPIMHLKLFHPTHDHFGLSPLEAAGRSVDLMNAANAWNKALLDNAARPSGALIYKGPDGADTLTTEQYDRLKEELSAAYEGAANAGRPLLLDGGLDWKQLSLTPAEMDFEALRNSAAREIALAFGVPPMLLGIPGDNTYANYREANLAFWKQTVLPLVKKTAAALTAWLEPAFPDAEICCDPSGLDALSAERDARWRRICEATFLSDDEKRAALGLEAAS